MPQKVLRDHHSSAGGTLQEMIKKLQQFLVAQQKRFVWASFKPPRFNMSAISQGLDISIIYKGLDQQIHDFGHLSSGAIRTWMISFSIRAFTYQMTSEYFW